MIHRVLASSDLADPRKSHWEALNPAGPHTHRKQSGPPIHCKLTRGTQPPGHASVGPHRLPSVQYRTYHAVRTVCDHQGVPQWARTDSRPMHRHTYHPSDRHRKHMVPLDHCKLTDRNV